MEITAKLFIQPFCRHAVESCQVAVQQHSLSANDKNLLFHMLCFYKVTICDLDWFFQRGSVFHTHRFRSRVRYWTASDKCFGARSSSPARSASVLETFRILSYPRALNPSLVTAFSMIFSHSAVSTQCLRM